MNKNVYERRAIKPLNDNELMHVLSKPAHPLNLMDRLKNAFKLNKQNTKKRKKRKMNNTKKYKQYT
jgi:hypothetical protein